MEESSAAINHFHSIAMHWVTGQILRRASQTMRNLNAGHVENALMGKGNYIGIFISEGTIAGDDATSKFGLKLHTTVRVGFQGRRIDHAIIV